MGMEDETRQFFILITQTISSLVLWLLLNITFGLWFGFGLFDETPSLLNYIYYAAALVSLFFLLRYLKKRWNL